MAIVRTRQAPGCAHGPGCPHDIGPAACAVDGLAAIGRVSAMDRRPEGLLVDLSQAMGSGPVERRVLTDAELAEREYAASQRSLIVPRDPEHRPSAGMHLMRRPARPAAPVPPLEDPVTTPDAPPAIPCDDCLHEPVCYLRRELNHPETLLREPHIIGPGLRLVFDGARVECDHHLVVNAQLLPARTIPVVSIEELSAKVATAPRVRPAPDQASRQRGADASSALYAVRRAEKDAIAIRLLREHKGNAEAVGRAMGVTGTAVRGWVARMRATDTLPADLDGVRDNRGRKAATA